MRAAPLGVFVENVNGIHLCKNKFDHAWQKQHKSLVIPICLPLRHAGWLHDHTNIQNAHVPLYKGLSLRLLELIYKCGTLIQGVDEAEGNMQNSCLKSL